jgi:hypothetical protein
MTLQHNKNTQNMTLQQVSLYILVGNKWDELIGEWRRLYGYRKHLHYFCFSLNIIGYSIMYNEFGGSCGTYGAEERCIQAFGWET